MSTKSQILKSIREHYDTQKKESLRNARKSIDFLEKHKLDDLYMIKGQLCAMISWDYINSKFEFKPLHGNGIFEIGISDM